MAVLSTSVSPVVYYDSDLLDRVSLAKARSVGEPGLEVISEGTIWPKLANGRDAPTIIVGRTSDAFRDPAMKWIEGLYASLRGGGLEKSGWQRHGASLLEVARYALLYNASLSLHRWWAMSEIIRRWAPKRLIWVSRSASASEKSELELLFEAASSIGTRVEHVDVRGSGQIHKRVVGRAKALAWPHYQRLAQGARRLTSVPKWPQLNGRPRIVFTEFFPNSAKASIPVARLLDDGKQADVVWVAGRDKVQSELSASGISSLVVSQNSSGGLTNTEKQSLEKTIQTLPEYIFSLGPSCPSFRAYALRVLENQLVPLADEAARWLEAYHQLLKQLKPVAIVSTTYSSMPGRAAALAMQGLGGKAIYIQHGAFPDRFANSFFCHDLMLMWGEHERRSLLKFGHCPDSLRVTGSTIYDRLFAEHDSATSGKIFPSVDRSLKIAYLASRTGGAVVTTEVARQTLRSIAEAASSIDNAELIVKTHPGDSTQVPEEVMKDFPRFRLHRGGSSQDIIASCDIAIVVSSTTGLEACALGKPLIVFNLTGTDGFVDYKGFGAAIEATSYEQLLQTIRWIQTDEGIRASLAEGRARVLKEMLNGGRGDAAIVAAREISQLLIVSSEVEVSA